jgi:Domain of unknown function (DUF4214)
MTLTTWLVRAVRRTGLRRRQGSKGGRRPYRPRLELLETRALLSTLQNFNIPGQGTPYVTGRHASGIGPAIIPGDPTTDGPYLRLASHEVPSVNTIAFDLTDGGLAVRTVADFDFRMTPVNGRADGFGFALLNTANQGTSGEKGGGSEEPNFAGSLGVGFDIFQNNDLGDINNNNISIHFNGAVLGQFDASPVNLASGVFIHAQVVVRSNSEVADVSVALTPRGAAPVQVVSQFAVPGMPAYQRRVQFGARSGGESAEHDLDNVNVESIAVDELDRRFVGTLYRDFLNRTPDPTGLGIWVPQAARDRAAVAAGILSSNEAHGRVVDQMYQQYLGRPANDAGASVWVAALNQGASLEEVAAGILASPEFGVHNGSSSDETYVRALYQSVLNRGATDQEVQDRLAGLPSLGRNRLALGLLLSSEFRRAAVRTLYGDPNQHGPYRFLPNLLKRETSPTASEVEGWVTSGGPLRAIEIGIAASTEYYFNS